MYGWSRKKMFATLFQLCGFQVVPLADTFSMSMLHGPSSMRRPIELEHPGPGSWLMSPLTSERGGRTSVDPHHNIICDRTLNE